MWQKNPFEEEKLSWLVLVYKLPWHPSMKGRILTQQKEAAAFSHHPPPPLLEERTSLEISFDMAIRLTHPPLLNVIWHEEREGRKMTHAMQRREREREGERR